MNEFTAKKLAEVEAFCKVSGAIIQRAGESFDTEYGSVAAILDDLAAQSVASAVAANQKAIFDAKLEKTTAKLTKMMELYIGDEWDNPVEVLEWTSFFTGAAAAHCALASELDLGARDQLVGMSQHYHDALKEVIASLKAVGAVREVAG